MRLLQRRDENTYELTHFEDEESVPPYAILSHTWGTDEVTYQDLVNGEGKTKPAGYDKIQFCAEQAWQDQLEYFWIDTCCIDKTDKAELSHAIKSMFWWYRKSARCYVYLTDVVASTLNSGEEHRSWELEFRESRWFTRGWTLQELLAPKLVEFFSNQRKRLGDKSSLRLEIRKATAIPLSALQGAPLHDFSTNERLAWSANRTTTLEEDKVYSMSGLFFVDLAPSYGERVEGAFRRLHEEIRKAQRCVHDLRITDPRDDKRRIETTKGGLLQDSYRWILDNLSFKQWQNDMENPLLWIKGDPGKGKTMLLCGIINKLQKSNPATVSYFFCQASDSRINNATSILRGLLYMLVSQQPWLISQVRKKYDDAGNQALFEDANAWIVLEDIFTHVLHDANLETTYLVIDALDECVTSDLLRLLSFVTKQSSISSRVKWVVSSRNWPIIGEQLERADRKVWLSLELNAASVAAAVKSFIEQKVSYLAEHKSYNVQTREAVLEHLVANASDTFLWVALVCEELRNTSAWNVPKKLVSFPPGLDSLYKRMMDQIHQSDDSEVCLHILAVVALVHRPITLQELSSLVKELEGQQTDTLRTIIGLCHSFLTIREDTVYFVHQSAKDFLFNTAAKEVFPLGQASVHHSISAESLKVMTRDLHRDMYELKEPGCSIDEVKQPDRDPLAASRYSCIYWIDHFCSSEVTALDNNNVAIFLSSKFLYWLEALSLCRNIPKGVSSIAKLRSFGQATGETTFLKNLLYDAHRFAMYHLQAIEAYPLQVYVSALLFSPTQSLIRNAFEHEEPSHFTIKPTLRDSWGACLQTLTIGEYDKIRCVAFSPNSRLLACTIKRTVNIYNATSGARLQTIEHSNSKKGVAFLSESLLAVASEGNLIRIWDLTIGVCLKALEGHEDVVNDVAFSGSQLASASRDGTVKIWDTTSGACLRTLADNSCAVTMVAFSSNLVAASSIGRITKIWNADSGMCVFTLHTNVYTYTSLAFSPDSTQLALTLDESVEIWDVNNGTCLQKLVGHTDTVHSVIFSRDATWLASASADRTVKIWSPSGTCLQTFTDHVVGVHLVALSHDSTFLASASSDGAVKLWDTSSVGVCDKNATGHNEAVSELVFLRDFTWLASLSRDRTVKIWDSNTGACLQTLEGFESHTIQIGSGNSTRLVILLWNKCVEIWDTDSSSASYSRKLTILSDWSPAWFPCVSLSHDSSRLASSVDSVEGDISILDISGNGASHLRTFEHAFNSEFIRKLAFSHDATKLASLSLTSIIIWDVISGVRIHKFDTDRHVANVAFNATGSYVHIGHSTISTSPPYDVVSLDRPEHPLYPSAGYSENGEWITYGGKNVLWMPTAYRSYFKIHCISPCGRKVAVGTKSGEVWIVNFNPRSSDELDSRDSGTRLKVC